MVFNTIKCRNDGFGSQFQHYIWAACYAEAQGNKFILPKISQIEHNYTNDKDFINNLIRFMSLEDIFNEPSLSNNESLVELNPIEYCKFVENNIDKCLNSSTMNKIRESFFKNNQSLFDTYRLNESNDGKKPINIVIHIRRNNTQDSRKVYADLIPFEMYHNEIERILTKIPLDKTVRLQIITQAEYTEVKKEFFKYLESNNYNTRKIILSIHSQLDTKGPFFCMAAADYLLLSPSSFSYAAAWLCKGEITYYPFWHNPSKNWNKFEVNRIKLDGYTITDNYNYNL